MTSQLVFAAHHRRHDRSQPHRRGAHVPVFGRRRLGHRLAPAALDDAGHVGRRHDHHRGDGGRTPRPHHPRLPRPVFRPQRGRGRSARSPRRAAWRRPARASASSSAMPAARPPSIARGRAAGRCGAEEDAWQTVAPSAIPFAPDWPVPQALDENGIQRADQRLGQRRRARGARRLRLHRDPRRPRLPAARVPVAARPTGAATTGAARWKTACASSSPSPRPSGTSSRLR